MKKIVKLLTQLGDTSGKIATSLDKLGIKGKINTACSCPIAQYLLSNGCKSVEVLNSNIKVFYNNNKRDRVNTYNDVSLNPIRQFIYEFDDGDYQYLIDVEA